MSQTWTISHPTRPPVHRIPEEPRRSRRSVPADAYLIDTLLEYELYSSWWADRIPFGWAQKLTGRYFAWKVGRKVRRYRTNTELARRGTGRIV